MDKVFDVFLLYVICSFLGWIVESIYRSFDEGRLVNSGFLHGPFISIYGFGALLALGMDLLLTWSGLPFAVTAAIITACAVALEYISGWVLEKFFNMRLWDYSDQPFNLHGRICLQFSLYWFLLTIGFMLVRRYFASIGLTNIPSPFDLQLSFFFAAYLSVDMVYTSRIMFRFRDLLNILNDKIPSRSLKDMKPERIAVLMREFFGITRRLPHPRKVLEDRLASALLEQQKRADDFIEKSIGNFKHIGNKLMPKRKRLNVEKIIEEIAASSLYKTYIKWYRPSIKLQTQNKIVARFAGEAGNTLNLDVAAIVHGVMFDLPLNFWISQTKTSQVLIFHYLGKEQKSLMQESIRLSDLYIQDSSPKTVEAFIVIISRIILNSNMITIKK
ncbi:MAG: putative ABC transporter permease [Spirochaetia bacterium]